MRCIGRSVSQEVSVWCQECTSPHLFVKAVSALPVAPHRPVTAHSLRSKRIVPEFLGFDYTRFVPYGKKVAKPGRFLL
jgi:hypothetical protein